MKAAVERYAPWLAAAVLVAGIAVFAVTRYGGSHSPTPVPPHRAAPLSSAERHVAYEFVDTAVARKHLDRAWAIVAPELRQGMSLHEWNTGTIPVVPYPVEQAVVALQTVNSFTDTASLRVTFVPRSASKVGASTFALGLQNVDGHWLVSSWEPTSSIAPPTGK